VPLLGLVAVHSLSIRPDLYDLVVRADNQSGKPPIMGWSGLTGRLCDCRVRMLGYMMDNERPIPDGTIVSNFVLVPEAGALLHPAHRIPEEMIDIRLRAGGVIRFQSRQLVWAEGLLTSCYVSDRSSEPLYCLTDAAVLSAEPGDISRFFRNP
jgi:hypothetical protein